MSIEYTKQEIKTVVLASLIMGIVFGFDDKQASFNLSYWTNNLIFMAILSFFILFIFHTAQKAMASHYGCSCSYEMWKTKRWGLRKKQQMRKSIPYGIVLPLLITIGSLGTIPFCATTTTTIEANQKRRFGKRYLQVMDMENAKIIATGHLVLLIAIILYRTFQLPLINQVTFMGFSLIFSRLLPFPKLDGISLYFSSRLTCIFLLSLVIVALIMMNIINSIAALITAIIIACIIVIIYYNMKEVS